jgi:hypothetical protein
MKHALLAIVCSMLLSVGQADVVKTGYFAGLELVPMAGARMAQLEAEPAAVLIFAADANSVDATAKFDQWFRDPNRPRVNVYAVSVGPEDTPFDVISEVLRQRELQVPSFHVRGSNLLNSKEYRLLVLDRGGKVRREFDDLDLAALNSELTNPAGSTAAGGSTAAATSTATTTTTISIDGGPAATPTPAPGAVIVEDVNSNEPIYYNQRFGMTVQFPPGWQYRIARNGDGAVCRSPRGRLDLRVWAVPNATAADGSPGKMSPSEYIQQFIKSLGEQNSTEVDVDRRFVVEDDDAKGRDYMYTYARLNAPDNPAAGSTRYRARIQVFELGGTLKVAGAEAPAREFDAAVNSVIEPFFVSFHPRIEAPEGGPPPPVATRGPGEPVGVSPAPPAVETDRGASPAGTQRSY